MLPLALLFLPFLLRCTASTTMWYDGPNVIPLGNGRLGAQMLGQVPVEPVILNEDHIWSGSLTDPNNKNCPAALTTIRNFIWANDLSDAQNTGQNNCMANPLSQQEFQTAGNLTIVTDHKGTISNYNHTLDLSRAISTTTYAFNGVQYTRTAFASHPDNVIVIRLSSNVTKAISFNASFVSPMSNMVYTASNNSIKMTGTGTAMYGLQPSIKYVATAHISVTGSTAVVGPSSSNSAQLSVSKADEALILIAIDTNYVRYDDLSADPEEKVSASLASVASKSFDAMLQTHVSDHSSLFKRVNISLGTPSATTYMATNRRVPLPNGGGGDPDIFALYLQYGRYLAIASSRKTEPPNLQGIWNKDINPSWGSKYTININLQMNSWLSEPLNLQETLDPLWNLIVEMAERGRDTARETYNITRGWVGHHNTGIWRDSSPIDAAFYGLWPMAPAWLLQHMYEHYAFDPDPTSSFLKNVAYPTMKNLSEFYLDFLVAEPVDGSNYLVTNPSMSPEHAIGTFNTTTVSLTYGSTIDNSLLRDLFGNTIEFAQILGVDADFAANLSQARKRLMPFRIGSLGQIQEWARDYNNSDANGQFTHLSHLYPLFPSAQIDPRLNKTLANAANTSLVLRGDSSSGWPTAWRVNCYARLLDGEKSLYYLERLIGLYSYSNLFSINTVFQIDANFGGANGIAEMILQSHNGEIHLLPAIPTSWDQGQVAGFRARGGFTLNLGWSKGSLVSATVLSTRGTQAQFRYRGVAISVSVVLGQTVVLTPKDFGL